MFTRLRVSRGTCAIGQAGKRQLQITDLPPKGTVQFGSTVTFRRADGRKQAFRIVGIDEANPSQGTLSYVSPVAQALLGRGIGDEVQIGAANAEIIDVS